MRMKMHWLFPAHETSTISQHSKREGCCSRCLTAWAYFFGDSTVWVVEDLVGEWGVCPRFFVAISGMPIVPCRMFRSVCMRRKHQKASITSVPI